MQKLHRVVRFIGLVPPIGFLAIALVILISSLGGQEEAAARPQEYSLCNISLRGVPADVAVGPYELPVDEEIYLLVYIPLPPDKRLIEDPETGMFVPNESRVAIDAETGKVVFEDYRSRPADEAKLKAVLATLNVGPPDLSLPAWPLTNTPPRLDMSQTVAPEGYKGLKYRPPEASSGMLVSPIQGSSEEQPFWQVLEARTCNSKVVIEVEQNGKGRIVVDDVIPAEKPMFDRFLDEVEGLER